MPATEDLPRPRRSDAQRNRTKILAAAEEVFALGGPDASTEDIARRAGVAAGTVFRHFPTKAALIEAVFVGRLRELTERATTLSTRDDAGTAFFEFFAEAVRQSTVKHLFTDAIDDGAEAMTAVWAAIATAGRDLQAAMARLLSRAQQVDAVRAGVAAPDLVALMIGAARAVEHIGQDAAAQDRLITIVGDGLRPRRDDR